MEESTKLRLEHGACGYGVVVHGQTASERKKFLKEQLTEPHVVIKCEEVEDIDEIVDKIITETGFITEPANLHIGPIDARRALSETGTSLIISEFEELDSDTRTSLAQLLKAFAEQVRNEDVMIGYACEKSDSVARAEWDLSGRLYKHEL